MADSDLLASVGPCQVDQDVVRNIVSLRASVDYLDDLSDDPEVRKRGHALEAATKPPYRDTPILTRPFDEAEYFSVIGYPFTNLSASRFSNGQFGVWYGADSLETTVYETIFHWLRRITAIAGFESERQIVIQRRVHDVALRAILLDLRPAVPTNRWLVDPEPAHYDRTQQLGAAIEAQGQPGLVTKSARAPGDVYAVFTERVLSNPRVRCFLTYRYLPAESIIQVERGPGTVMMAFPTTVHHHQ